MLVSKVIEDFGTGTMWVGGGALFVMAVVGTMSIDIVMMAAAHEQAKKGKFLDLACTMYVWHMLSGSNGQPVNPLVLLAISPITSAIAIILSVAYEVPMVGVCIAGGWGIAASILLLGWAINTFGQWLGSSPKNGDAGSENAIPVTASNSGWFSSSQQPVEATAYVVDSSIPVAKEVNYAPLASAPLMPGC